MKMTRLFCALAMVVALAGIFSVARAADNPFRLQAGAKGKLCLNCHAAFKEKLDKKYVHTPVKEGECASCHNPHASNHGALLAEDKTRICASCHAGIVPENPVSQHEVVTAGECVKCHDPHAADNPNNLLKAGNELCLSCHEALGKEIAAAKFKHAPVQSGCVTCHNPHGSNEAKYLLTSSVPSLCLDCHDAKRKIFRKQHMDYPVEKARCTSCHNPHGSTVKGMFFANLHPPVQKRMCNQCHEGPDSAEPFATKKQGYELCNLCHSTMINEVLTKKNLHWPVVDATGCQNCHTPHASKESALLKDNPIKTCGSCHQDTIQRQERSKDKHQPIAEGECSICHSPHSSDQAFFLKGETQFELCGQCHDWQAHSTHPLGGKVVDPRNPNRRVRCNSCHRTHGTEYDKFLYFGTTTDLCVQCHKQYRR